MKKVITVLSILTVLVMLKINEVQKNIPNYIIRSEPTELEKFLHHIALRESDNTPTVVNQYGMLGKYQFHPATIKILGYRVTKTQFLSNPELQDSVMVAYLRLNNKDLNSLITKYDNTVVKGIKVTRAGILAAAHLAGSDNVRSYLIDPNDNIGTVDANGTTIREYMKTFSKYHIKL